MRALGALQAITWIVLQVLWYTDTRIFNIFRYHFNAHVWNLLSTEGSDDSVHLGWQVSLAIVLGLSLGSAVQYLLWRRWLLKAEELRVEDRLPQRLLRPGLMWCVVLLGGIFIEKSIYAQADLNDDKQITALGRYFPAYPKIPAQDFARDVLGLEEYGSAPPRVEILPEQRLDYPHLAPELDPAGARPNVLFVVVDCWRADMLGPELTPFLWEFRERCLQFDDHWSGGNSTRFGLFSMLYGLHGSYWFPVLAEGRSPVLLDTLSEAGYDIGAFAAADMHYPELRSTVWSQVEEGVHDMFPAETNWERDLQARAALLEWVDAREDPDDPFFGFYLVDSPHPTYGFPPDEAPYQPIAEEINYLAMSRTTGPLPEVLEGVFNRYRNAVHHADELIRVLVEELEQRGLLEDTLLVITGDHGEEFRENGYFGHTSNFTPEQCAVPLLLHGAGIEPGRVERPTSHVDLPATVLELLGADPSLRGAWTLGGNLLESPSQASERRRVVSAWQLLGLRTPEGQVLRVPLYDEGSFQVEVYDEDWQLVLDDDRILERERGQLERLAEQCRRFLAESN